MTAMPRRRLTPADDPPGCVSVLVRARRGGRCVRYVIRGEPPRDRRWTRERRQWLSSH